jgi:integrase
VVEMFRELHPLACGSEYVMPGRFKLTQQLSGISLNKSLESVVFENLEHLTIHDLRRTGATLLTEHGWNADVIEKALAHEKTGIRALYIVADIWPSADACCSGGPITSTGLSTSRMWW